MKIYFSLYITTIKIMIFIVGSLNQLARGRGIALKILVLILKNPKKHIVAYHLLDFW